MQAELSTRLLEQATAPPIALWTFEESGPPYRDLVGGHLLHQAPDSRVRTVTDPDLGSTARFDGRSDYLRIPAADVGDLNVSRVGNEVTVLAWVRRRQPGLGFVAGMWQEHDDDPRRQYGLFIDLSLYGGKDRVAGHVSRTGAASAGLPYSRDACASARMIALDTPAMVGFSYDGELATAYLDGIADPRPEFHDPPPPYGQNLSYPKNPYRFTDGLNRDAVSDFTVGAVQLTSGMGNFFSGEIGAVMIFDRVLAAPELMSLHLAAKRYRPIADLGFFRTGDLLNEHDVRADWPIAEAGWTSWPSTGYQIRRDAALGYLTRSESLITPGVITFASLVGLPPDTDRRLSFRRTSNTEVLVLARLNGRWYATDLTSREREPRQDDWVAEHCDLRPSQGNWQPLRLDRGGGPMLSGRPAGLPCGRLEGVGFLDPGPSAASDLRIAEVRLH